MAADGPYISKWITFSASAFIQASAGLSYSFSVYAPTIKDTLNLTQTQLATVGSAVNLGGYFAVISGSVYDSLKDHHRLGPRLVLWLGCLCCFCGYMGLYLMASGQAPNNFLQLLIFAIAAGNMGTWFDTTTLVTNVRNFPNDRGFVVGVLKSFLGLSSSIYTTIYIAGFEPDAVCFLLVLAIVPTVLGLVMSLGLNYVPFVEASEGQHSSSWTSTAGRFLASFLLVGVLAVYQMASAVLVGRHELSKDHRIGMVIGMLLLLALAAGLPWRCGSWRAIYAHHYIATRESLTDDEEARPLEEPSSPLPVAQQEDKRVSAVALGHGTAHHRAVGAGSSNSRPGSAVSISQSVTAAAHHSKPQRHPSTAGGSSSRHSTAGRKDSHLLKPLSASMDDIAAEAAPLIADTAAKPDVKAAAGTTAALRLGVGSPTDGRGPSGQAAAPLHMSSLSSSQMLCTLDFWLLFLQFTVGSGVCLAFLNNLGQLVGSLGGGQYGQVVFVSLFSVANAAGRLLMGYIPEQHLHARGTPRTMFLTLTAIVTAASCLAVAYANLSHLYVISVLLGIAFGAHWSLLPAITSDLFGLKHFAANYTTLQFAPAVGSYLLATKVVGYFYDKAAEEHGDPHACVGDDCFQTAFLLLSSLSAMTSIACSVATSRSRKAYIALAMHLKQVDVIEGGHGGDRE